MYRNYNAFYSILSRPFLLDMLTNGCVQLKVGGLFVMKFVVGINCKTEKVSGQKIKFFQTHLSLKITNGAH